MSKRTFLLCASLGTLVLSTVTISAETDSQNTASDREVQKMSRAEDASFELLSAAYSPQSPSKSEVWITPVDVDESTIWIARAIYSETKLPHEQELVAWVIRNRVTTGYRGKSSYRDVVLDPYQFSAFNPGSSKRSFLMSLEPETQLSGWQQALWIAHYVRQAEPVHRPFSMQTRHFYSERSMKKRRMPYWADGSQFVSPGLNFLLDERRFRFYEKIS